MTSVKKKSRGNFVRLVSGANAPEKRRVSPGGAQGGGRRALEDLNGESEYRSTT